MNSVFKPGDTWVSNWASSNTTSTWWGSATAVSAVAAPHWTTYPIPKSDGQWVKHPDGWSVRMVLDHGRDAYLIEGMCLSHPVHRRYVPKSHIVASLDVKELIRAEIQRMKKEAQVPALAVRDEVHAFDYKPIEGPRLAQAARLPNRPWLDQQVKEICDKAWAA